MNQRRFALIDKEIQGRLTAYERIELSGLTRIMREQIDSETNLPMKGPRSLHRKLLQMGSEGELDLIFDYPELQKHRLHEPAGYIKYESYRPWLRDEFQFRCVYCLKREIWGQVTFEFELDHFQPQSLNPELRLDYLNLVYASRRCNAVKRDLAVADPFRLLRSKFVTTLLDGPLQPHDSDTQRLIRQLDLNSPRLRSWRVMSMATVTLAKERDPVLYHQLVGFPEDLPDLSQLRPPRNLRKEGLKDSWSARRERGELPVA